MTTIAMEQKKSFEGLKKTAKNLVVATAVAGAVAFGGKQIAKIFNSNKQPQKTEQVVPVVDSTNNVNSDTTANFNEFVAPQNDEKETLSDTIPGFSLITQNGKEVVRIQFGEDEYRQNILNDDKKMAKLVDFYKKIENLDYSDDVKNIALNYVIRMMNGAKNNKYIFFDGDNYRDATEGEKQTVDKIIALSDISTNTQKIADNSDYLDFDPFASNLDDDLAIAKNKGKNIDKTLTETKQRKEKKLKTLTEKEKNIQKYDKTIEQNRIRNEKMKKQLEEGKGN